MRWHCDGRKIMNMMNVLYQSTTCCSQLDSLCSEVMETLLDSVNSTCSGRQTCGGEKKCIPLTLGPTIKSSVMVSHLIWLLALCEKSQSCVWFGANSKTRALTNPWDQALSVGLTSSRHAPITFSGFTPTPSESASHQQLGLAAWYIILPQLPFSPT